MFKFQNCIVCSFNFAGLNGATFGRPVDILLAHPMTEKPPSIAMHWPVM